MRSIRWLGIAALLVAALLVAAPLSAQGKGGDVSLNTMTTSVLVAAAANSLQGPDVLNGSGAFGFALGMEALLPRGETVTLRGAVQFARRGGTENGTGFTHEVKGHYVEVVLEPMFARTITDRTFLFSVGPVVGFTTGCSFETRSSGFVGTGDCTETNPVILSATGSVGMRLPLGKRVVIPRIRFQRGLNDMKKNFRARTQSFQFELSTGFGVNFSL